jgi:hypothetical protein
MDAAEVRQGHGIADTVPGDAQPPMEDLECIGAGDGMHGVIADPESPVNQGTDAIEVEQPLHQGGVIGDGVYNLHRQRPTGRFADVAQIDPLHICFQITIDGQGALVNSIHERFGCLSAGGGVELDAEVAVGSARIVTGGEQKSAGRAPQAYQMGRRGRRQQAVPADDEAFDTIAGGNGRERLYSHVIVVTTVTACDEGRPLEIAGGIHDALQKILEITGLLKDSDLLAQSGCARPLIRERAGAYGFGAQRSDRIHIVP